MTEPDGRAFTTLTAVRTAKGITGTDRAVLYALAMHATGATGVGSFPSQSTLEAETGLTDRTVRRALVRLEERGMIKRGDPALAPKSRRGGRPVVVWDICLAALASQQDIERVARPKGTERPNRTESPVPTGHRVRSQQDTESDELPKELPIELPLPPAGPADAPPPAGPDGQSRRSASRGRFNLDAARKHYDAVLRILDTDDEPDDEHRWRLTNLADVEEHAVLDALVEAIVAAGKYPTAYLRTALGSAKGKRTLETKAGALRHALVEIADDWLGHVSIRASDYDDVVCCPGDDDCECFYPPSLCLHRDQSDRAKAEADLPLRRSPRTEPADVHGFAGSDRETTTATASPSAGRKGGRATPIPDGFVPSDALVEWTEANCPNLDRNNEWGQFVAWAQATGKTYVDWEARWKQWALKAQQDALTGRGMRAPVQRGFVGLNGTHYYE